MVTLKVFSTRPTLLIESMGTMWNQFSPVFTSALGIITLSTATALPPLAGVGGCELLRLTKW